MSTQRALQRGRSRPVGWRCEVHTFPCCERDVSGYVRATALEDKLTHDLDQLGLVAALRLGWDHVVTERRLLHL